MRTIRTATALVATLMLVTACGEQTSEPADGSVPTGTSAPAETSAPPESPSAPVWTGKTIPDGSYTKTSTVADVKRLGIPMSRADELLGKDGVGRVRLVVKGDVYAQFGDDGTQGDGGSATYDSDGNWVTTSASTGCPGCMGTWKWSYDDGRLRLKLLEGTEVGDPVELLVTRLVVEGTYARR